MDKQMNKQINWTEKKIDWSMSGCHYYHYYCYYDHHGGCGHKTTNDINKTKQNKP